MSHSPFDKIHLFLHINGVNPSSDPLDRTLQVAVEPYYHAPITSDIVLPSPEEIILRLVYGWFLADVSTLCVLSGFSRRTIVEILPDMVEKGWIKSLGRALGGKKVGRGGEIYSIGSSPRRDGPFPFVPRFRMDAQEENIHRQGGVYTSRGLIIPAHRYYVPLGAAWLAQAFAKNGRRCLAVPEQVLRRVYGWYYVKDKQALKFFFTPVPDAWLILKDFSLRLEVQVTHTSNEKVRAVCEAAPLGEPVFYLVTDNKLHRQMTPLLKEIPNFCLCRLWNEADRKEMGTRLTTYLSSGAIKPLWIRDHYGKFGFAISSLKKEVALEFWNQRGQPEI